MTYTQHPVDLLPDAMRARTRARVAAGRNFALAVLGAVVLTVLYTHARVLHERKLTRLNMLNAQALVVREIEEQSTRMQKELDDLNAAIALYHKVETPVLIHQVIATIVHEMPESVSIDRLDIDADPSRRMRRPRGTVRTRADVGPRILVVEVAGIAKNDQDVTQFLRNLERRQPFSNVSLDFTRQKTVRDTPAREFRLSLTVDFEQRYQVTSLNPAGEDEAVADAE